MATRIRFFGAAAFEVVTPQGLRIVIDPFLDDNPASPVETRHTSRVRLPDGGWATGFPMGFIVYADGRATVRPVVLAPGAWWTCE